MSKDYMKSYCWHDTFRKRMDTFQRLCSPKQGEVPVSIKVRINFGCFHREHSPRAYQIIDRYLNSISPGECVFEFEEHESGPEIRKGFLGRRQALRLRWLQI